MSFYSTHTSTYNSRVCLCSTGQTLRLHWVNYYANFDNTNRHQNIISFLNLSSVKDDIATDDSQRHIDHINNPKADLEPIRRCFSH